MADYIRPTPLVPVLGPGMDALGDFMDTAGRAIRPDYSDRTRKQPFSTIREWLADSLQSGSDYAKDTAYGAPTWRVPELSNIPQFSTRQPEKPFAGWGANAREVDDSLKPPRVGRDVGLLDFVSNLPLATAGKVLGAVPALAKTVPMAAGAIRLGGKANSVATHATRLDVPLLEKISDKGLYAPSIGLSVDSANHYKDNIPALVYRAGVLDRHFPNEAPASILNRDGYFWNPRAESQYPIKNQWELQQSLNFQDLGPRLGRVGGDARLSQMAPDKGSQTASVLASPSFRNLEHWENSPVGYGAIRGTERDASYPYRARLNEYTENFRDLTQGMSKEEREAFLMEMARITKGEASPYQGGRELGEAWDLAENAPSEMGEYKIYAPSVPAGERDASIWLPRYDEGAARELRAVSGHGVYGPKHLAGLKGDLSVPTWDEGEMPLHLLAPADGKLPPSPREAMAMYDELLGKSTKTQVSSWEVPKIEPQGMKLKGPEWAALSDTDAEAVFDNALNQNHNFNLEENIENIFDLPKAAAKELYDKWLNSPKTMPQVLQEYFKTTGSKAPVVDIKATQAANANKLLNENADFGELYNSANHLVGSNAKLKHLFGLNDAEIAQIKAAWKSSKTGESFGTSVTNFMKAKEKYDPLNAWSSFKVAPAESHPFGTASADSLKEVKSVMGKLEEGLDEGDDLGSQQILLSTIAEHFDNLKEHSFASDYDVIKQFTKDLKKLNLPNDYILQFLEDADVDMAAIAAAHKASKASKLAPPNLELDLADMDEVKKLLKPPKLTTEEQHTQFKNIDDFMSSQDSEKYLNTILPQNMQLEDALQKHFGFSYDEAKVIIKNWMVNPESTLSDNVVQMLSQ